jgi:hypothetical protein
MDQVTQDAPARDYGFLEGARRLSRFKAARERVTKIAGTEPRFTATELAELAAIFTDAAARARLAEAAGVVGSQAAAS